MQKTLLVLPKPNSPISRINLKLLKKVSGTTRTVKEPKPSLLEHVNHPLMINLITKRLNYFNFCILKNLICTKMLLFSKIVRSKTKIPNPLILNCLLNLDKKKSVTFPVLSALNELLIILSRLFSACIRLPVLKSKFAISTRFSGLDRICLKLLIYAEI